MYTFWFWAIEPANSSGIRPGESFVQQQDTPDNELIGNSCNITVTWRGCLSKNVHPHHWPTSSNCKSFCRLVPLIRLPLSTSWFQKGSMTESIVLLTTPPSFVRRRILGLKMKMTTRIKLSKSSWDRRPHREAPFYPFGNSTANFHQPIPRRQRPNLSPCTLPVPIPSPKMSRWFSCREQNLPCRFAHKPSTLLWNEANSVFKELLLFWGLSYTEILRYPRSCSPQLVHI